MAKLQEKIETALNESRMLVLGTQVLLGFQYRSAFQDGFERLPVLSQQLNLGALGIMLLALGLLLWPAAYHRIVTGGEDAPELHRFTTKVMESALLPFAAALGIDLYITTEKLFGRTFGVASGLGAFLVALFFWYGLEVIQKVRRARKKKGKQAMKDKEEDSPPTGTPLSEKIQHVLTEARMVLPGVQALLGFQFAIMLMDSFDALNASSKYVHWVSLGLIALSGILLMTPAAYHRIVEEGEESKHFHLFASRMILAAMVPLALGLTGDFFVVTRRVTGSTGFAVTSSLLMLVLFYGLWFGFTIYRKSQRDASRRLERISIGCDTSEPRP